VIGNHDYDLLDFLGYVPPLESPAEMKPSKRTKDGQFVIGSKEEIAMSFDREAAEWMLKCPYILKVGDVGGEELVAVHAGLLPGTELEKQDPWGVINMRNIYENKPIKKTDKGHAWAEEWNESQKHLPKPTTVIYGHDARRV